MLRIDPSTVIPLRVGIGHCAYCGRSVEAITGYVVADRWEVVLFGLRYAWRALRAPKVPPTGG